MAFLLQTEHLPLIKSDSILIWNNHHHTYWRSLTLKHIPPRCDSYSSKPDIARRMLPYRHDVE